MKFAQLAMAMVVAGLGGWFARSIIATDVPTIPSVDPRIDSILGDVRSLRATLEAIGSNSKSPTATAAEVIPTRIETDSSNSEEVRSLVKELQSILVGLQSQVAALGSFTETPPTAKPENTDAVAQAIDVALHRQGGIGEPHFCWTARQIYAKYGAPDTINTSGSDVYWRYVGCPGEAGLIIDFAQGLVVHSGAFPKAK